MEARGITCWSWIHMKMCHTRHVNKLLCWFNIGVLPIFLNMLLLKDSTTKLYWHSTSWLWPTELYVLQCRSSVFICICIDLQCSFYLLKFFVETLQTDKKNRCDSPHRGAPVSVSKIIMWIEVQPLQSSISLRNQRIGSKVNSKENKKKLSYNPSRYVLMCVVCTRSKRFKTCIRPIGSVDGQCPR